MPLTWAPKFQFDCVNDGVGKVLNSEIQQAKERPLPDFEVVPSQLFPSDSFKCFELLFFSGFDEFSLTAESSVFWEIFPGDQTGASKHQISQ